jgi:CrcB protein
MLRQLFLIGMGGFIGSIARYLVSRLNVSFDLLSIPFGTLTVNVVGSFVIGFLTGIADKSALLTQEWRLFLMVGICGGFTTFSSFTNESLMLMHNGQYLSVLLYTALSVILGFLAVYLGFALTNTL